VLGVKPLFPWQLQQKMTHNPSELALLDVRTPWEFRWFHLPEAQNVPFEKGMPRQLDIPRNKAVVVICMTGHRSPPVAYHLLKAGYTQVYNLTWGMAGWEVWKWTSGRTGID
jgi:rhodanese-related sulfurtransferase